MISPSKRRFLPPLGTKKEFNVYNEEYAKRTKDEVDSKDLKETIKKLNKEIRKKKNDIRIAGLQKIKMKKDKVSFIRIYQI